MQIVGRQQDCVRMELCGLDQRHPLPQPQHDGAVGIASEDFAHHRGEEIERQGILVRVEGVQRVAVVVEFEFAVGAGELRTGYSCRNRLDAE